MIFSTAKDNHLQRSAALTRKVVVANVFSAFVTLLGEGDAPTAEAAALSLASNVALGSFDQLQKHGKIQCEKVGKKYSFLFLFFLLFLGGFENLFFKFTFVSMSFAIDSYLYYSQTGQTLNQLRFPLSLVPLSLHCYVNVFCSGSHWVTALVLFVLVD